MTEACEGKTASYEIKRPRKDRQSMRQLSTRECTEEKTVRSRRAPQEETRYCDTAPARGMWIELSNRRLAGDDNNSGRWSGTCMPEIYRKSFSSCRFNHLGRDLLFFPSKPIPIMIAYLYRLLSLSVICNSTGVADRPSISSDKAPRR
jgi:hypothetical protein